MVQEGIDITITVSDKETADWIRSKVQSGAFPSETDLVAHGIATLRQEDADLEHWLRTVVADRYDRHKQNPEKGIPAEQVMAALEARRKQRAHNPG